MFGDNLRRIRKSKRISQTELAKRVGLTRATISRYESNDRTKIALPIIRELAAALGVREDDLTNDEDNVSTGLVEFDPEHDFDPKYASYIPGEADPERKKQVLQDREDLGELQFCYEFLLNRAGKKVAMEIIKALTEHPRYSMEFREMVIPRKKED